MVSQDTAQALSLALVLDCLRQDFSFTQVHCTYGFLQLVSAVHMISGLSSFLFPPFPNGVGLTLILFPPFPNVELSIS